RVGLYFEQGVNDRASVGPGVCQGHVVSPSGLANLLTVTGRATERTVHVQTLSRLSGRHLWIELPQVHEVGRRLRVAQLQLRLEHKTEPRQSQRKKYAEENERAVVHRAASATCGLTAAIIAGTQQARQQRASNQARFNARH